MSLKVTVIYQMARLAPPHEQCYCEVPSFRLHCSWGSPAYCRITVNGSDGAYVHGNEIYGGSWFFTDPARMPLADTKFTVSKKPLPGYRDSGGFEECTVTVLAAPPDPRVTELERMNRLAGFALPEAGRDIDLLGTIEAINGLLGV